ncbi:MAG: hypothetical protein JNK48_35045 [Bryobacterales bacterium]|nr:hypothetical protein [Bryobacterales bacterium]
MKALAASKDEAELAASGALRREMATAIVDWGVVDVSGLVIDGVPASKELLLSSGPEALVLEIVGELQKQLSLSEDERKN